MKTLDRLIFAVIAVALCILAVKSFMSDPVRAAREEIIKVNVYEIGSVRVWKNDLVRR